MSAIGGVEVVDLGFVSTEAITKFRFVKADGGQPRGIDMCDTAGEKALGVAQHDVSAAHAAEGAHANVRLMGISVIEAGAALTVGADVMTDAAGKAVAATATNRVLGTALMGASADGDLTVVALAGPGAQAILA